MHKNYLSFGVHFHQPLGESPHVIMENCEKIYKPFLKLMEKYPDFKFLFHVSGCLLEWMEENQPECLDWIRQFLSRGQMELLAGGFYEPFFPLLREEDQIQQIQLYKKYARERFNTDPGGIWLAEKVWEFHLPKSLAASGIAYTLLDDHLFHAAGILGQSLYGYYLVEHDNHVTAVYPVQGSLLGLSPFQDPEATVEWMISELNNAGGGLVLMFEAGEKWGPSPGSAELLYEKEMLEQFLRLVLEKQKKDKLITAHAGDFIKEHGPEGRVYLPSSSSRDLGVWSLPLETRGLLEKIYEGIGKGELKGGWTAFVKGGVWRNILVQYPEINQLQKRISQLSYKLADLKGAVLEKAQDHLCRAQCHTPFWHGPSAGVYLLNIRQENYSNLIRAEKEWEQAVYPDGVFAEVEESDLDCDGEKEVRISTPFWDFLVHPSYGGGLSELAEKENEINLDFVLRRRKEAYHAEYLEERRGGTGIDDAQRGFLNYLIYDWYRRYSFLDHFFHPDTKLADFWQNNYGEQGDFVNQPYGFTFSKNDQELIFTLEREGGVWFAQERVPVRIRKAFHVSMKERGLRVVYELSNLLNREISFWFAPELNISLFSPHSGAYLTDGETPVAFSQKRESKGKNITMRDDEKDIALGVTVSEPALIWHYPVEQIVKRGGNWEKLYQGSSLTFSWNMSLGPLEKKELEFFLEMS